MKKFFLLLTTILSFGLAHAQIKTEFINYKGWGNSVELSNDEIKLIVVPQIGRIMYFSYITEKNLLYENSEFEGQVFRAEKPYKVDGKIARASFGGDRIWPTKQDDFEKINGSRGLSDPWIDGSEWEYTLIKDGVKITSRVSNYLGVIVTRLITLNKKGATVNIQQKMEKVKLGEQKNLEPIPVTIWSLSQVKNPDFGILPLSENSIFENSIEFQEWPDTINSASRNYSKHGNVGQLIPMPNQPQKMGTDSRGWVAGVYNDKVFGQFFTFDKSETYPDGGTSATIFTCTDFTELECLSPEKKLKVGETLEHNIQWKLKRTQANSQDEKREQATKWLNEQLKN